MSETVIRPTMKFIFLGYVLVMVMVVVVVALSYHVPWPESVPPATRT